MTEHEQKYSQMADSFGLTFHPEMVGVTIEQLVRCYKEDEHLNNIPLARWDRLHSPRHGSLSNTVCMYKYLAKKLALSYLQNSK